ncbi:MAG: hypothetical protein ABIO29_02040 [Sphingomicrobium sp.]
MKHWRPDMSAAVPLEPVADACGGERQRKRDWTSVAGYAPPRARPQHRREAALGGWIGVAVVALLCGVLALGAVAVTAGPDPIDRLAIAS